VSELTETIDVQQETERSKVESWRLHVLIQAGYPLPLAEMLAASDADTVGPRSHRLRPLGRGFDPPVAAASWADAAQALEVRSCRRAFSRQPYE